MISLNPSRKLAARPRAGGFLALFRLFGMPAALIPALLTLVLAGGATASAQVVTNSADSGPGTLRSAITNADNGAVITFDPSLSGATIALSNTLTINTNLTIDASALPGGLQINGNGAVTVFNVASTITVFLNSLTITNAYSTDNGGGIYNSGTLTLTNCILSGNYAVAGGGIANSGTLTLNQCTLSGNSASGFGGGIANSGLLTLNQCSLSGDSATDGGGGIFNYGLLTTLNQCTLSGNSTKLYGGGIYTPVFSESPLALNQCTLSGNSATDGGGIAGGGDYSPVTLNQCTLSGNSATNHGGGIYIFNGAVAMTNTIVAGNSYPDIGGNGSTFGGANLVQTGAPHLAPLGNYGGPTQTMPPLPGSPAIDAGSNAATNNFATDQRGLPRFVGPQVDIGAVEFQASPVVTNADSGPGSLRYAIVYATNNATITFDPSLSGATNILTSGELLISTNLTIDASALPGGFNISGNQYLRVFEVPYNTAVTLNSLTIQDGYSGAGGGIFVNSGASLTVNDSTFSGNDALSVGGGIFVDSGAGLTLNDSTFSGNWADYYDGGGIYVNSGASLTLNDSMFSGNETPYYGGGIVVYQSTLTINNSTFSGNQSYNSEGGGIFVSSTNTPTINGSTFSANSAGLGGGISCRGNLLINNSTFSANYGHIGGGLYVGGTLTINNSTFSGNTNGGIRGFSFPYLTNTIVADTPGITFLGANNLTNSNPLLAPLGNYGGPTQTMPPLPGSPAIGAGSVAANTFSTDQRGYPRTQNGLIDIGAVEVQSPAANPPVLENITVPAGGGNGLQFTFTSAPAADFTVLTATNVSLALTNWTVLGEVQQVAPGQYQFTDPQAATNTGRFYRVRSP